MKSILSLTFVAFSAIVAQAQIHYYSSSSSNYSYSQQYISSSSHSSSQNLSVDNAVNQTFGYLGRIMDEKKDKEEAAAKKEKMAKRVQEMRNYYTSLGTYPEKVIDGWHEALILGGDEYISEAKFLVKNNKITAMVWDNWLPQELAFSGPIMKGKSGIKIKDGKGALEGLIEVMFINHIADNTSVSTEPLKPGKITFWTNNKNIKSISLAFEDMSLGHFTHYYKFDNPPVCGGDNEIVVYYKPGLYSYKAIEGSSWSYNPKILCEGKIRITDGGCEIVQINKEKYLKK
jgi:hypothetical protein